MTTEFNAYHQELSNAQGWTIIEDLTPDAPNLGEKKYLLQNHDCGHTRAISRKNIGTRAIPCLVCRDNAKEAHYAACAEERGFEYVGAAEKPAHVTIKCHDCGTAKDVHTSNLTRSSVRCRECDAGGQRNFQEAAYTYLARVTMADGKEWIKSGSARMLDYRIRNLSSKNFATVELLKYKVHPTRKAAYAAELDFKKRYSAFQIDCEEALKMKIEDGRKEAFSPEILKEL